MGMDELSTEAKTWLSKILGGQFTADKHIHSHQDEVYKIRTPLGAYYLKISATLEAERDNLERLEMLLNVPKVIDFHSAKGKDFLPISEVPGKNLAELVGTWSDLDIVSTFAEAIRYLHAVDVTKLFPQASSKDVLLHGDMALPNIIISDQGRIGYIDFGQMAFGPPDLDVADAIWSLQRNIGPDFGELFLKAYGPVTVSPMIEKALKFRYQPS
jgi:aminoglycoside phosphotransferase